MKPGSTSRPTRRKVGSPKIEASQTQALRTSGLRLFLRWPFGLPASLLKESDCGVEQAISSAHFNCDLAEQSLFLVRIFTWSASHLCLVERNRTSTRSPT